MLSASGLKVVDAVLKRFEQISLVNVLMDDHSRIYLGDTLSYNQVCPPSTSIVQEIQRD